MLLIVILFYFVEGTPEEWREMVDVNIIALCLFTKESINLMREKNIDDGQIIHIGRYFEFYFNFFLLIERNKF